MGHLSAPASCRIRRHEVSRRIEELPCKNGETEREIRSRNPGAGVWPGIRSATLAVATSPPARVAHLPCLPPALLRPKNTPARVSQVFVYTIPKISRANFSIPQHNFRLPADLWPIALPPFSQLLLRLLKTHRSPGFLFPHQTAPADTGQDGTPRRRSQAPPGRHRQH